jgi:hypothetical protein
MTTAGGVGVIQSVAVGVDVGGAVTVAVGGLCVGVAAAGVETQAEMRNKRTNNKGKYFFIYIPPVRRVSNVPKAE